MQQAVFKPRGLDLDMLGELEAALEAAAGDALVQEGCGLVRLRLVCALAAAEKVNPEAVKYLNRLSDHLFVLGRRLNDNGAKDVLWRPGATRDEEKKA